jgi:hypothetical protein
MLMLEVPSIVAVMMMDAVMLLAAVKMLVTVMMMVGVMMMVDVPSPRTRSGCDGGPWGSPAQSGTRSF